jgi:tetratricopeptide (TPR) repeat protein
MTICSRRTKVTDRVRAIAGLAVAFALAMGHVARADGVDAATQAKADVLFEKGQAHYQAGEFQAAIQLFQDAYGLVNDPVYLFNIAQSYRKVLDCVAASDYYNRYLTQAPGDAKTATKVQQWLRELQPCVEQRKQEREAVEHAAVIEREQKARDAREEAERQRKLAAARAPVEREVDHGRGWRLGGIAAGSVGAVGLVVGVVYSAIGASKKSQVASAFAMDHDWTNPTVVSLDKDGRAANTYATIGYIAGGVLALGGAAMYVYGRIDVEHVVVTPTPSGATVGITGSF